MATRTSTRRSIIGAGAASAGLAALGSGGAISKANAQAKHKTFVLIHGAWVAGWYWRRVADLLESKGHKVFSPTLTGLGERSHLLSKDINLDTHVADIVNVIIWESLNDICIVAHSYGGFPGSGALEQIGQRVNSIVWVDALKPESGQRPIDFTASALKVLASVEKGEDSIPPIKAAPVVVNDNDSALFNSKVTAQPVGTYLQPIALSGARERVAKKTYIRALRFPNPALDTALAECKTNRNWNTIENSTSGHCIMLDEPEWLADQLLKAT